MNFEWQLFGIIMYNDNRPIVTNESVFLAKIYELISLDVKKYTTSSQSYFCEKVHST